MEKPKSPAKTISFAEKLVSEDEEESDEDEEEEDVSPPHEASNAARARKVLARIAFIRLILAYAGMDGDYLAHIKANTH